MSDREMCEQRSYHPHNLPDFKCSASVQKFLLKSGNMNSYFKGFKSLLILTPYKLLFGS